MPQPAAGSRLLENEDFPPSAVVRYTPTDPNPDAISLPGNTFVDGQAVTYHASAVNQFSIDVVDVTPQQVDDPLHPGQRIWVPAHDSTGQVTHDPAKKNILLPGHAYQTGDAVTYRVQGGTSIIPAASVRMRIS